MLMSAPAIARAVGDATSLTGTVLSAVEHTTSTMLARSTSMPPVSL